jgi:hypothetical protein
MVWGLGAGELPGPYVVSISRTSAAPEDVQHYIALQARCLKEARAEKNARDGYDIDVSIKIES